MNLIQSRRDRQHDSRRHWLGVPIETFTGTIDEVSEHLPEFERRPFAAVGNQVAAAGVNSNYDVIVRLPTAEEPFEFPVGLVSRSYQLVRHRQVLDIAREALVRAEIDLGAIHTELTMTENGERARLSFEFPDAEEFRFRVAPEDDMRLRLECLNSVDGSTRFVAVLGWLRFVCSNGLVLGATLTNFQEMHTQQLALGDVGSLLESGLRSARQDKKTYDRWLGTTVHDEKLTRWVDGPLLQAWKLKAATRVFHIALTGHDVILAGRLRHAKPTNVSVNPGKRVPGWIVSAKNAFDVSQALSWVAGQRRDFAEHLQWRAEIPGLVQKLID